jgi:hypothetical protein
MLVPLLNFARESNKCTRTSNARKTKKNHL